LKNDEKFIVISCDKNLGHAVIERDEYVRRALKEHLVDKSTYERIHEGAAKMILHQMKDKVRRFTFKHSDELEEGEHTSTSRSLLENLSKWVDYNLNIIAKNHQPIS